AQDVQEGEKRIESLRLASSANVLLQHPDGNVESAALLSIRSLRVGYSPEAEGDLYEALQHLYTRQIFLGHTNTIESVAFSPDGRYSLTGSADNSARLWDASTGQELRQFLGHTNTVETVAFSPDGRSIVTGSTDNAVRWWDANTGQEMRAPTAMKSTVF